MKAYTGSHPHSPLTLDFLLPGLARRLNRLVCWARGGHDWESVCRLYSLDGRLVAKTQRCRHCDRSRHLLVIPVVTADTLKAMGRTPR